MCQRKGTNARRCKRCGNRPKTQYLQAYMIWIILYIPPSRLLKSVNFTARVFRPGLFSTLTNRKSFVVTTHLSTQCSNRVSHYSPLLVNLANLKSMSLQPFLRTSWGSFHDNLLAELIILPRLSAFPVRNVISYFVLRLQHWQLALSQTGQPTGGCHNLTVSSFNYIPYMW